MSKWNSFLYPSALRDVKSDQRHRVRGSMEFNILLWGSMTLCIHEVYKTRWRARHASGSATVGLWESLLNSGLTRNPVLPLADSPGGHLLGVNGLAIDPARSLLYGESLVSYEARLMVNIQLFWWARRSNMCVEPRPRSPRQHTK